MANTNNNSSPIGNTSGNISPAIPKIDGNITYGIGNGSNVPEYEGSYTAVPKAFETVVLPTKDKKLIKDITIKEIPYYETTNASGGNTVYIAGQIEFY